MRAIATPVSIYRIIACLMEYRYMLAHKKMNKDGVRGLKALARRYKTTSITVKRWVEVYEKDVELFDVDRMELLRRMSFKDSRLARLAEKYTRLRTIVGTKNFDDVSPYAVEVKLAREEIQMFRDLYQESQEYLKENIRAHNETRAVLNRVQRHTEVLEMRLKRKPVGKQGMLPHVNVAARCSP